MRTARSRRATSALRISWPTTWLAGGRVLPPSSTSRRCSIRRAARCARAQATPRSKGSTATATTAATFFAACVPRATASETGGYEFGPISRDVGKRLTRRELIESIIEPSKKLDAKYITSMVITADGKALVGFVKEKTDDSLTLLMQEGKQETLATDDIDEIVEMKQSSMPENLASTLSPTEFLDVIEYLSRLRPRDD